MRHHRAPAGCRILFCLHTEACNLLVRRFAEWNPRCRPRLLSHHGSFGHGQSGSRSVCVVTMRTLVALWLFRSRWFSSAGCSLLRTSRRSVRRMLHFFFCSNHWQWSPCLLARGGCPLVSWPGVPSLMRVFANHARLSLIPGRVRGGCCCIFFFLVLNNRLSTVLFLLWLMFIPHVASAN